MSAVDRVRAFLDRHKGEFCPHDHTAFMRNYDILGTK